MSPTLWVEPYLGTVSGGLRYNHQVRAALRGLDVPAHVLSLPMAEFSAGAGAEAVRDCIAEVNPATVVVDGLIGSAHPELFEPGLDNGAPALADVLMMHLPAAVAAEAEGRSSPEAVAREERAVTSARFVVTPSRWGADELRRRYRRQSIHVAVPGVHLPEVLPQRQDEAPVTFACVAALNPLKNHRLLVDALEPLQDLPWRLILAGPGAHGDSGSQLVAEIAARLPGRVEYRGVLDPQEVTGLWGETDLVLLPSLVETYGMVVTEACAYGVPAFVAADTGAHEALGDAGSALATVPKHWTAALREFLTSSSIRCQLREKARRRRHDLPSWEAAAQVFARLR